MDSKEQQLRDLYARYQALSLKYQKIKQQLERDPYSGLPLRRQFDATITKHLRAMQSNKELRGGVLIIRFSELLKRVGTSDYFYPLLIRIISNIQSTSHYVYQSDRIEEIIVFFPHSDSKDTLRKKSVEVCNAILKDPVVSRLVPIHVLFYAGMYQFVHTDLSIKKIIQNAHYAIAEAADRRVQLVAYSEKIAQNHLLKRQIERELYKLVNSNFLGFTLYYQPIFYDTGEICGVESLLRWSHKTIGNIPPDVFIPLAEESGYITFIDRWVLYQVMSFRQKMQDIFHRRLKYFINLSAQRFSQSSLIDQIKGLDEEYGVGQEMKIEITEHSAIQEPEIASQVIHDLKKMEVSVVLDDFGTGFCSLSYLMQFAIDVIKTDRAFISNIHHDTIQQAIIENLVTLAKELGIQVIIEGVEKEGEMNYLRRIGCDMYQGYLLSHPLSGTKLIDYLKAIST